MSRHSSSEPDPPNVTSVKSRTSSPRLTVICRSALAWFHAETSRIPAAHSSAASPSASPNRPPPPARPRRPAGPRRRADAAGCGPSTRCASVTVTSLPPCRIAHRPRLGAGRSRPDLERPVGRDPGHGAAARAHGDDVDHRDLGREKPDRPSVVSAGSPPTTTATSVEVPPPSQVSTRSNPAWRRPARHRAPRQPARTARSDRLMDHLGARQHSAVGLHHVERDRRAGGAEARPAGCVTDCT